MPAAHRPLICITTRPDPSTPNNLSNRAYSEAVLAAGGIPVLVPLLADAGYLTDLVSRCDGVLLTGSNSDIDPARYGQAPHVNLGDVCPEREEVDFFLLAAAEARRLPVLGICFGMQSINVYRGGTLFQDLPSQVENAIQHQQQGNRCRPSHNIQINRESLLAKLAGGTTARVNSSHHQAIDEVGRDLEPVAWSADGVVEAIANTHTGHFTLGVQWHPERQWERDQFSQAIFKHFVAEAAVHG